MAQIFDEILDFVAKGWTLLVLIFIGIVGKFSFDMLTGRKVTIMQAVASTGAAFFIGVVASIVCYYFDMAKAANIIVPLATLLSEKIMIAIFALDVKTAIRETFKEILRSLHNKFK